MCGCNTRSCLLALKSHHDKLWEFKYDYNLTTSITVLQSISAHYDHKRYSCMTNEEIILNYKFYSVLAIAFFYMYIPSWCFEEFVKNKSSCQCVQHWLQSYLGQLCHFTLSLGGHSTNRWYTNRNKK